MIIRAILRMLWVAMAFGLAVGIAVVVLLLLGAGWVGDELRAAPPHDPMLRHGGARALGMVLFASTVVPALTVLPALIAVIVGEVLRLRSWTYYVLAGGAALLAIPLLAGPNPIEHASLSQSQWMTIFAAAGFAGGFIYWLLAGRNA